MKFIVAYFSRLLFVLFVLLALVPAEGSLRKSKRRGTKKVEAESLKGHQWKKNKLSAAQEGGIEWAVGHGQKVAKNELLVTLTWFDPWQNENTEEPVKQQVYSPLAGSVKIHHKKTSTKSAKGRTILEIE